MDDKLFKLEILKLARDIAVDEYYTKESKKIEASYPSFSEIKSLAIEIEDYVR